VTVKSNPGPAKRAAFTDSQLNRWKLAPEFNSRVAEHVATFRTRIRTGKRFLTMHLLTRTEASDGLGPFKVLHQQPNGANWRRAALTSYTYVRFV
jgi:hypothetical protein